MRVINDYLINKDTQALIHHHNKKGQRFTIVKETTSTFIVKQATMKIIRNSFQYYVDTLDNNIEHRTYNTLQFHRMFTFKVNGYIQLCLFPVSTSRHSKYVWVVQSQIDRLESISENKMRILFNNGNWITIKQKQRKQANINNEDSSKGYRYNLRKERLVFKYERTKGIQLVKETGSIHYTKYYKRQK